MCPCHEPLTFGHQPDCPVRPGSQHACTGQCPLPHCWRHCMAWREQARVFGWAVPEVEAAEEAALA